MPFLTCLEHLPYGGHLGQIGCMLSRRPVVLRLCLELQHDAVLEYLRTLRVPADFSRVADILDLFGTYDHDFLLHLDVLTLAKESIYVNDLPQPNLPPNPHRQEFG